MNPSESESSSPQPTDLRVELGTKPGRHLRRSWLLAALVFVAVGTGAVAWLSGQQSGPSIRWATPEVVEFLLPSTTRKITVSFRSNQDLSDVAVFVTPSLPSRVTVSPQTFRRIRANRDNQLTLELSAPPQSQVKFEGTVHLRSTSVPTQTYAEPLPITLVIHNEPVPPDPGDAGKQTLEGIDSDGDGVRDDVQRYIIESHLTDVNVQRALEQLSRSNQTFITQADSHNIMEVVEGRHRAQDCLNYVTGNPATTLTLQRALREILLNTQGRTTAYVDADTRLGGTFFPITDPAKWHESCE